ncbi:hypothetical protein BGZ83_006427, partial [Gryganskiella cystojenkinii]
MSPMTPSFSNGSAPTSYFASQSPAGSGTNTSTTPSATSSVMSPTGTLSSASGKNFQSSNSNGSAGTGPGQRNIVGVLLANGGGPDPDSAPQESMFLCLQDLFQRIQNHSKKTQFFTPTAFVAKVKKENELFRSSMHQDAHEFLMFIIGAITEDIEADYKRSQKELEEHQQQQQIPKAITNGSLVNGTSHSNGSATNGGFHHGPSEEVAMTLVGGDEVRIKVNGADIHTVSSKGSANGLNGHGSESIGDRSSIQSESTIPKPKEKVWVQKLFEGQLTNEIKCLTCEKTTNRAESFMDLSLDIEQNSSVTSCLRQFSASEMLCHKDKFYCDECCGLQEAEKRMKIQVLPNILCLHLKRFKYQEALQKYVKLSYRVLFPLELRLFNTVDDMEDPDRIYDLNAFVVHVGNGPHHGHYVAVVKHQDRWLLFDDETVETIEESDIPKYFGDSSQLGSGYVLFYQARDMDMSTIAPLQWAQHQLQQMQQHQIPVSLKNPFMTPATPGYSNGLAAADLDQYGGLLPHTQQQELIHQQLASRQQQLQGGGGLGSFFGSSSPVAASVNSPSPIAQAHLSQGPRSPTQIQDPSSLNGQRIPSGSYVYTNGIAAAAAAAAASSSSSSSGHQHYANGPGQPPSSPSLTSQHTSSKSSSGSAYHTTIDPAKLKRAQSTPRITLASAAKTFGSSGGKSFMNSIRGGSSS